jgi:hypothetical protein
LPDRRAFEAHANANHLARMTGDLRLVPIAAVRVLAPPTLCEDDVVFGGAELRARLVGVLCRASLKLIMDAAARHHAPLLTGDRR